jgi:ribosome-associated translation inhibitor RaiA
MQRPLEIAFKHLDSSDFIRNLVVERVERLERFHPHIIGCRVVIEAPYRSAEGHNPPLGIAVEVDVANRPRIVAKESEAQRAMKGDHLAAITRAFEAIERQLEDVNDRQRGEVKAHENARQTGSVVRLFPEQEHGFIEIAGGPELYFTRNVVIGGSFDQLEVGTMVQVTAASGEGPMGPQASSVEILGGERRG